jgi:hypothetical protein
MKRLTGILATVIAIAASAYAAQRAQMRITDAHRATPPKLGKVFFDLFQASQTGDREAERAGFVTRDTNGEISFVAWPATAERRSASFNGIPPPNTIAIAHTHPDGMPDPSRHDIEESMRIRLPIYVVARTAISRVNVDGSISRIIEGMNWTTPGSRMTCEAAARQRESACGAAKTKA